MNNQITNIFGGVITFLQLYIHSKLLIASAVHFFRLHSELYSIDWQTVFTTDPQRMLIHKNSPMISPEVGFTFQTSRTNNTQVISTFKFRYPRLTLKEGPKVKSEHIRRFPAHDYHRLVSHAKPLVPIIREI